jgi:TolA-binding protein
VRYIPALIPVLLLSACWGGKFIDMPGRVERMEADQAALQAEVDSLRAASGTTETLLRGLQAQSGVRTAELIDELSALSEEMSRVLRAMQAGSTQQVQAVDTATSASMQTVYNEAYLQYQQRDFSTAAAGFRQVFSSPGAGGLADDALYFTALCHESLSQPHQAIEELVALWIMFPDSDRAPAALSRAAAIYGAHGASADRQRLLDLLLQEYPDSDEAELARSATGTGR